MTYPRPQTILSLLALMVAGLAGNYFGTPIFFGIEFLFGSIFSLLAMQLFGYGPGVIAALVISSITFFSHQQPLVIFVMILEVVAVGWLYRRKDLGLVLIDALYWLCLGMPFAYFVGQASPLSPPSSSLLILVFGKTINGISNALLARLIFMAINSRSRETLFPLKEVLFNLLTLFVLIPSFLIMAHENQDGFGIVGQSVRKALKQSSQSMKESLESWLEQKSTRIVHLAWRSGHDFPDMQQGLDFLHSLDPDLNAVGVIDKQALSTAFSPQFDELGQSTIGKDFSDRPYLTELKRTLSPQLSDVVLSKIGKPLPITVLAAPILVNGVYDGYAAAILNLDRIDKIIFSQGTNSGLWCTLVDRNKQVIATNRDDLQVMAPFPSHSGTFTQLEDGISQWQQHAKLHTSSLFSGRVQDITYIIERPLGGLGGWRLIVEQPLGPTLTAFHVLCADQLELIFYVLMVALIFAELVSRRILASVMSLQEISTGLPNLLEHVHEINWPSSFIREVETVTENFKQMALLLVKKISDIKRLNLILERRVDERTKAFQESEEKYHIIFETQMYAICIFDLHSQRLLECNGAFSILYGYNREETLAGLKITDINAWHEDTDFVAQAALRKGAFFVPLRFHRKKDGSIFPVELAGGPYIWQGRLLMFVIVKDITERHQAAESLRERTRQLEDMTENLASKVEAEVMHRHRNEQILIQQSKLAAMGEMMGAIAHQWRQPLNSLGLCIQNIKDAHRFGELTQEDLDSTVHDAMVQINHMSRTIDDFRNFFLPEKEASPFDVMLATGHVLTLIAAQLTSYNIAFTLTCRTHQKTFLTVNDIMPCSAKITVGYKNKFEHVLLNLITNAKDAILERRRQGLMLAEEPGMITFEFQRTPNTIVIWVSDNGGGIPEQTLTRVFEPYFTTKDPDKGTGLGLYLSKIIIEDHMHGQLSVENTEHGASFVLVLPAQEEAPNTVDC